jgi:hypothetical protein
MKTTDFIIEVRFPKLNKNGDLTDNDREIGLRNSVETCKVVKVVSLSPKEWQEVTSNLLADRPELWRKIGGQSLSNKDEKNFLSLCREHGTNPEDWETWIQNPLLLDWFNKNSYTEVVEVKCRGKESFYVNTEGRDYARYVGRLA